MSESTGNVMLAAVRHVWIIAKIVLLAQVEQLLTQLTSLTESRHKSIKGPLEWAQLSRGNFETEVEMFVP